MHSADCDLVKKSLHDLHNYSAVQCNFKRRDTQIPIVGSVAQNVNTTTTSVKEKPVRGSSPASVKSEEKKKPLKETQAALFFGGKTSKESNKEGTIIQFVEFAFNNCQDLLPKVCKFDLVFPLLKSTVFFFNPAFL